MSSLVKQAQKVTKAYSSHTINFSKDEMELVFAWVKDEVSLTQVYLVMKHKSYNATYTWLARALKIALQSKEIPK